MYTTSTLGRTLAEEGFIHAARADQWQGVRARYYADVTEPLVLLVIDPSTLTAPVMEEPGAPGSSETFPHVYGVIETTAVEQVLPLGRTPHAAPAPTPAISPAKTAPTAAVQQRSFLSLMLEEMSLRAGLGLLVIVVSVALCLLVLTLFGDLAGLVTVFVALAIGFALVAVVLRRRERRLRASE